ncbi:MAG: O-antigen ligase family protein [Nitrospirota bacterium]|nr:O-antigen ligase family protein [Nitrospirota bacterium]
MNNTQPEQADSRLSNLSPSSTDMARALTVQRLDYAIEASLIGLLIVLPIAHVTAVRSFFIVSAGLLCLVRMGYSGNWKVKTPLDLPLFLYTATVVISVFFAINPIVSLKEIQGELLQYLVVFYAAAYTFRDEKQIKRFAVILCGWILLFGLIGLVKLYLEGGATNFATMRLKSLARGVTNYSDYIVLTFPLVAWAAFRLVGMKSWVARAALVVALVTQILTHSRAGWIAICIELFLIVYLMQKQRLLAAVLLIALIGAGGLLPKEILYHGGQGGFNYDTRQQAYDAGTESIRLYQWGQGVKEMLKHPFQGFGYSRKNYIAGMNAAGPGTLDVSSCNAFLDAWLQLGLQGMAALIFLFISLAITLRRYARQVALNELMRSFFTSGLIIVIGYFMANQFQGSYVDEMAITFWLLMGLFVGYGTYLKEQSKRVR